MRPSFRLAQLLVAPLLLWPGMAEGVVVLRKGATQPLVGVLVREDDRLVVVRETLAGGGSREHTILRDEIDELLLAVDPARLTALDPAQPRLYLEYAEELAEKARDPEARAAAIRLFHMAAWLDSGKLRKSSLLGLAGLARSPTEERQLRAAAYLHDPEHDRASIAPARPPAVDGAANREAVTDLASAFRSLRQGKMGEARAIAERPASLGLFEDLAATIGREQFLALCTARPLSDRDLRRVLAGEILLLGAIDGPAVAETASSPPPTQSWSEAAAKSGLDPIPSLELLQLTEFDPRACLFREGKWVAPK